jgi:hypothetical protein
MRGFATLFMVSAAFTIAGCGGVATKNNQNASTAATQPPVSNAQGQTPSATANEQGGERVESVNRTTSDGNRIVTRELVGPNVQAHDARPLRADEVEEIEKATGRPYQEGDSIHGRAQPAPK